MNRIHRLIIEVFEFVKSVFDVQWFTLNIFFSKTTEYIEFHVHVRSLTQDEMERLIKEAKKRGYTVYIKSFGEIIDVAIFLGR